MPSKLDLAVPAAEPTGARVRLLDSGRGQAFDRYDTLRRPIKRRSINNWIVKVAAGVSVSFGVVLLFASLYNAASGKDKDSPAARLYALTQPRPPPQPRPRPQNGDESGQNGDENGQNGDESG